MKDGEMQSGSQSGKNQPVRKVVGELGKLEAWTVHTLGLHTGLWLRVWVLTGEVFLSMDHFWESKGVKVAGLS